MTGFNPLVEKEKAIAFPEQTFYLGRGSATKKEQGVGNKETHMKSVLNDGCQRINPIAKIRVTTDNVDTGKGTGIGIFKHDTPPSLACTETSQERMHLC